MINKLLMQIETPKDLRVLFTGQLPQLAKELREYIINIVSVNGGHLGANLGVIELTIALHYSFDTPNDILIWDVGHQAYAHKILTGRRVAFKTNRQWRGISGFPSRKESKYDDFGTGHSSTSISAVLGMALSTYIKGDSDRHHIAVIGDASIVSGMAWEALNHLGSTDANVWIILNDNSIGIDYSVGAMKEYFKKIGGIGNNIFSEAFNLTYLHIADGHNILNIIKELERLKKTKGPKLIHIRTIKGKGLKEAEDSQVIYHAPSKFDVKTGKIYFNKTNGYTKYQDVFGKTLVTLARNNKNIVGITAAMPTGTSLKYMMEVFPQRTFDVGISEQHAVTLAAGMVTQGIVVYCAIYSTFLQRALDQIIHDVVLQCLPVIFCIDRAGLVGQDGSTHHGVFDVSILRSLPHIHIVCPRNEIELRNTMYTCQLKKLQTPIAIRYPKGNGSIKNWKQPFKPIPFGKAEKLHQAKNKKIAVISLGTMANTVTNVLNSNSEFLNSISHYDIYFLKPIDTTILHEALSEYNCVVTVEELMLKGGLYSEVCEFAMLHRYKTMISGIGIENKFIPHGSVDELLKYAGLDIYSIRNKLKDILDNINTYDR